MAFAPRLDILPRPQRLIWPELQAVSRGFVLYGGTAVALHLGHRTSVDFDFFSSNDIDVDECLSGLSHLGDRDVLQAARNTVTVLVDREGPIKLSFFGGINTGRVDTPLLTEDSVMLVASRRDLLAHKLKTVYQRVEAKDYIDVAALLRAGESLRDGLEGALAFWPDLPVQDVLRALCYFQEGDFAALGRDDRAILVHAARFVDLVGLAPAHLENLRLDDGAVSS